MSAAFTWAPFLPPGAAATLVALAILALLVARMRRVPDFRWRGVLFVVLALFLLNPVLLREARESLPDKLIIVMDDSASQKIGNRDVAAEEALAQIKADLAKAPGIEPVVIRAAGGGESTALFAALRDALPGLPLSQAAGTVFITDGQVHDAPPAAGALERLGPFHAVLTGRKDETDRKVTIVSAPKYGLLSENVDISVRVDVFGKAAGGPAPLSVLQDGKKTEEAVLAPGEVRTFRFKLAHPGQNVFEFTVPEEAGELTAANNTAPVIVNGVRDRLRVLLVSGAPHMGERAWRNLLKSDPSIDLVHFTILRSLASVDRAARNELSLIPFPVDELFQKKLGDFDLVIFDKYQRLDLLSPVYFRNLADFVRGGGAFLMAMDSVGDNSAIFETDLAPALPVTPEEKGAVRGAYLPQLTEDGRKHPVTGELSRLYEKEKWGAWYSQAALRRTRGQILMTGEGGLPLLVLDRVGEGRVAVLASDNVWLWSKGAGTRGPYVRLLRNAAHWLMKEPELEDDFIKAEAKGRTITVSRRMPDGAAGNVTMTTPAGTEEDIILKAPEDGWAVGRVEAEQNGIYSFAAGEKKAFVVVGTASNPEFSDVHTTEDRLRPLVDASGGSVTWFQDDRNFSLRSRLKRNHAYTVSNVDSRALLPDPLALLLLLAAAMFMWWREGGARG